MLSAPHPMRDNFNVRRTNGHLESQAEYMGKGADHILNKYAVATQTVQNSEHQFLLMKQRHFDCIIGIAL